MKTRLRVIFAATGACALVYQVVWVRLLGLVFGNTTDAVSAVLCAFMGGMAIGSWGLGRAADRSPSPLKLYAGMEAAVGLYALATPWLVGALQTAYVALQGGRESDGAALIAARFLLAAAMLGIPTALMGGTLPVLARHAASRSADGGEVARLYAANVLGAVLGVLAAPFVLIPALGVRGALIAAAVLNLAAAACAWAMGRSVPEIVPAPPRPPMAEPRASVPILAACAVLGLTALAYEVAWSRVLALTLGSSVYAFALMVAGCLAGVGAGGWLAGRLGPWAAGQLQRRDVPAGDAGCVAVLALLSAGAGVSALLLIPAFGALPLAFLRLFRAFHETFAAFEAAQFGLVLAVVFVPAALCGAGLPFAAAWRSRRAGDAGSQVGELYGANTVGAVVGSLLAAAALIPWLGQQGTLIAVAMVNITLAVLLLAFGMRGPRVWRGAVATGLVFFAIPYAIAVPSWNKSVLASGVYRYAPEMAKDGLDSRRGTAAWKEWFESNELLYYREGAHFTVSVTKDPAGVLGLAIDGKADASTLMATDMQTQVLSARLPLIFAPGAKRVLVVGLASGVTLGSVLRHPVAEVDVVEIEPAMAEASRFFTAFNGDPLKDPRVRLIWRDGRNHLLTTRKPYDVIISVPSNPWVAGSSALFTREYFELVKSRLAPGGVFCFWMQTYELPLESFRTVVRTALSVFPGLSLWRPNPYDVLFMAIPAGARMDHERVEEAAKDEDVRRLGIRDGQQLLARFLMDAGALARFAPPGPLNTDDRPRIEFAAPRSLYATRSAEENARELARLGRPVSPLVAGLKDREGLIEGFLRRGAFASARAEADLLPAAGRRLFWIGEAAVREGNLAEAEAAFEASRAKGGGVDVLLALSYCRLRGNDIKGARRRAEEALRAAPGSGRALLQAGRVTLAEGRVEEAAKLFARARKAEPGLIAAYLEEGRAHVLRGVPPAALVVLDEALRRAPDEPGVHHELGRAFYAMGLASEAADSFRQAIALDPGMRDQVARTVDEMNRRRR